MNNLTKNIEASQGDFEIPSVVPVNDAIADLIFDFTNLNDLTTLDTARSEARSFLHQHPAIKYANESAAGLRLAEETLLMALEDKMEKYQILNSISAIRYLLNKIEGAE